jgi:hypothetical protein
MNLLEKKRTKIGISIGIVTIILVVMIVYSSRV